MIKGIIDAYKNGQKEADLNWKSTHFEINPLPGSSAYQAREIIKRERIELDKKTKNYNHIERLIHNISQQRDARKISKLIAGLIKA